MMKLFPGDSAMSFEMWSEKRYATDYRSICKVRMCAARLGLIIAGLIVGACDSGSFGSDVDSKVTLAPIA